MIEPLAKGPEAGRAVSEPRLLIVEDDEAIQTQLKYALRDEFSLILAGDRPQALARLREAQPPVVTLDLGLPPAAHTAEDGLKTLEEILRVAPSTRGTPTGPTPSGRCRPGLSTTRRSPSTSTR